MPNSEAARLDQKIEKARDIADEALANIEAHERECAVRYRSIDEKLNEIPRLKDALEALERKIMVAIIVLAGVFKSDKLPDLLKLLGLTN